MRGLWSSPGSQGPGRMEVNLREEPWINSWMAAMVGVGLFLGVMIFASIVLWLYLLELGEGAGEFLDLVLKVNLVMAVINLIRLLLLENSADRLLHNTAMIFLLSMVLHTVCFCFFQVQVLICPEQGSTFVYEMSQFIVYVLMAAMLSLLPSVVTGILMKGISCLFPGKCR